MAKPRQLLPLRALVNALLEIIQHVITRPHGEGNDWHGRGLIGRTRENAGVADVEIWNVVSLRPLVRNRRLRIISKAAYSGFVQTGSWTVRLVVHTPHLSTHCLKEIRHHAF